MSGTEYWMVYSLSTGAFHMKGSGAAGSFAQQGVAPGDFAIRVPVALYHRATQEPADVAPAIWECVKAKRDAVIDGGAMTPIGVVDSDMLSRINIAGAAQGASIAKSLNQPFTVVWTDQANGTHTLDADGMIAVGLAVLAHVAAAHDNARALRTAIEGAADLQALLQVDIGAGWAPAGED